MLQGVELGYLCGKYMLRGIELGHLCGKYILQGAELGHLCEKYLLQGGKLGHLFRKNIHQRYQLRSLRIEMCPGGKNFRQSQYKKNEFIKILITKLK
jgi:hypothetical protein